MAPAAESPLTRPESPLTRRWRRLRIDSRHAAVLDIVFTDHYAASTWLAGQPGAPGTFAHFETLPTGSQNFGVVLGDWNRDGLLDIYAGNNQLLINTGVKSDSERCLGWARTSAPRLGSRVP